MKPVFPSHYPMQSWNSRNIMLFVGWGEGLGMYDYEESPTMQVWPKTFFHDSTM